MKLSVICGYTILVLLFLVSVSAGAEEYKVYPSGKPVLSKYNVVKQPNGDFKVYRSGKSVISKYTVKKTSDGYSVYKTGRPVLPEYRLKKEWGGE